MLIKYLQEIYQVSISVTLTPHTQTHTHIYTHIYTHTYQQNTLANKLHLLFPVLSNHSPCSRLRPNPAAVLAVLCSIQWKRWWGFVLLPRKASDVAQKPQTGNTMEQRNTVREQGGDHTHTHSHRCTVCLQEVNVVAIFRGIQNIEDLSVQGRGEWNAK